MTYARITAAKAATPATAKELPKELAAPVKAIGEPVGLTGAPVAGALPVPAGAELAPTGLAGAELAPAGTLLAPTGDAGAELAAAGLTVTVDRMVVGTQVLTVMTETTGAELALTGLAGALLD